MTLEEAIKHTIEVANETSCAECRAEHLQLVAWLQELQEYRNAEKGEQDGDKRTGSISSIGARD